MSIFRFILTTTVTSSLAACGMVPGLIPADLGKSSPQSASSVPEVSRRDALIGNARAVFSKLQAATKDGQGPIPAGIWAELDALLKEADTVSPKTRISIEHDAFAYRLYDAWYQADAPSAVAAAMYGATLEKSGSLDGKKTTLTFEARANRCYALVGKFARPTGTESVLGFNPRYPANIRDVVPTFPVDDTDDVRWAKWSGACAVKDIELRFDVELSFPGSSTDYDWAFVSWPREALPIGMASRTGSRFKACSGASLESAFRHGPPGTLMWTADGVPGLRTDLDQGRFFLKTVDDKDAISSVLETTAAWPTKKTLASTTYRQTCDSSTGSEDALVAEMIRCHRDIEAEFGPRFDKAIAKRDNALLDRQIAAAQSELDKLKVASANARAKRCGPLVEKVESEMVGAMTRVNDWFIAGEPDGPVLDVPGYMRDVLEGWTPSSTR